MGQIVINDPHGFDTIFSTAPESPAHPYIREYRPQSLEDLYDIGVIPKHVPLDSLQKARKVGLQAAAANYVRISSATVRDMPVEARRQYVEASSNTMAHAASVRATAQILVTQNGYAQEQADFLALKAHSFDDTVKQNVPFPFVSVLLADDLIVKTRLVVDSSIDSITAKAVIIHRTAEIVPKGKYFLLKCNSIQVEGFWWETLSSAYATLDTSPLSLASLKK